MEKKMIQWKGPRKTTKGKYVCKSAFADLPSISTSTDYTPTFTILPYDHDGLISMEQRFLEYYADPTEYRFVQEVFEGDVTHWEVFKNSIGLCDYYQEWKQKALKKLQSEAMQKLVESALNNNIQALKYLLDMNVDKRGKGRPKKPREAEEVDTKDLLADIARLK